MIGYFFGAVVLSFLLTPVIGKLAFAFGCVDVPDGKRKIHTKPIPLLGGFAIFWAFVLTLGAALFLGQVNLQSLPLKFIFGIFGGGVILMFGGFLDDKFTLSAKRAWVFPALASLVIVLSGIGVGIKFLTNPFGGIINLDYVWLGVPLSGIFTWVWLMATTYTTKILDGLDGLVSGVGIIAALVLFVLSLRPEIAQSDTALLSLILAGSLLGFLPFAWHPAKIFLGESGSTFVGFVLGVLSVLSGAKIATAVLVMGLPILDVAWAVLRRLYRRQSPFRGDREHIHHLLLNAGFSHEAAVLCYYAISSAFGFTAVFLQSQGKFYALSALLVLMLVLVGFLTHTSKKPA